DAHQAGLRLRGVAADVEIPDLVEWSLAQGAPVAPEGGRLESCPRRVVLVADDHEGLDGADPACPTRASHLLSTPRFNPPSPRYDSRIMHVHCTSCIDMPPDGM